MSVMCQVFAVLLLIVRVGQEGREDKETYNHVRKYTDKLISESNNP